jgi:Domain of unknown function (DUF4956)
MDSTTIQFLIKLFINIAAMILIVGFVHYRLYKKSEYIFTYVIFNLLMFLLSFVLQSNEMSIGAAFGLFGVFSMIRYRTEDITARDMTYLFIVIALGILNAVHKPDAPGIIFGTATMQLLAYNVILVLITFLLESNVIMKRESMQTVQYENIANIKPENKEILLADLSQRTGLTVHRVEIGKIDFLRDSAVVKMYYYE